MSHKEITLPITKATVKLRDPKTIKQKDRKLAFRTMSKEDEGVMRGVVLIDALIAILVEDWTLDLVIPSINIEILDELELADYDALQEEALAAQKVLFPNPTKDDETVKDPKAPTTNSND